MFHCPHYNHKSSKVEIQTTEVGSVRWLNPKVNKDGTIEDFGEKWEYLGGETLEGCLILCKNCGEVIKECYMQ